jgi:predicted DNA-binding protein (MmcQ/YjbR family)
MNIEWVRRHCLSFSHSTETVQWGNNLVFKVGGKIYAIVALEPGEHWISFKCAPEDFVELTEHPGIVPARYLARAHWIALEQEDALPPADLKRLLRQAYDLVVAKLPKKAREAIAERPRSPLGDARKRR